MSQRAGKMLHSTMPIGHKILSAFEIDYSNVEEICGYQLLMCKIFESEGGFSNTFRPNAKTREIQIQGCVWLKKVKSVIDDIVAGQSAYHTLSAIPRLLSAYDLYCRICKGESADDYIRSVRLKTVDLWAKGDKSISETDIVIELLKEVRRDNRTLDRKYSTFALRSLGDWVKELMQYGTFRNTPSDEAYARLRCVIDHDLFAYLDPKTEAAEKARWIKSYKLSDDATLRRTASVSTGQH